MRAYQDPLVSAAKAVNAPDHDVLARAIVVIDWVLSLLCAAIYARRWASAG